MYGVVLLERLDEISPTLTLTHLLSLSLFHMRLKNTHSLTFVTALSRSHTHSHMLAPRTRTHALSHFPACSTHDSGKHVFVVRKTPSPILDANFFLALKFSVQIFYLLVKQSSPSKNKNSMKSIVAYSWQFENLEWTCSRLTICLKPQSRLGQFWLQ